MYHNGKQHNQHYGDSTAGSLPEATARSFKELGISKTIIIRGAGVLPAGLEKSVPNPERYSGADRFVTNAATLKGLQEKPVNVYGVTGLDYADSLAVAAVAAWDNSWLILRSQRNFGTSSKRPDKGTATASLRTKRPTPKLTCLQRSISHWDENLAGLKALVGK